MIARLGTDLTDRELEVLAAYCQSEGSKGAAARLGLSVWTIHHHLGNVRTKLGVTSTAAAVYLLRDRLG